MPQLDKVCLFQRCADLYHTYARAVDSGDLGLLRALVTDDVSLTRGGETEHGVDAFMAVYRAHQELSVPMTRHAICNIRVLSSGPAVRTEAYFESIMFEPDQTRILYGLYEDVNVEDGDRLLIAHKVLTVQRVVALPASTSSFAHVQSEE